jgi:hypothetical protein
MVYGARQRGKKAGDQIIENPSGMDERSIASLCFQKLRYDPVSLATGERVLPVD